LCSRAGVLASPAIASEQRPPAASGVDSGREERRRGVGAQNGEADVLMSARAGPAAVRGGALRVGGYIVGVIVSALAAALLFRHLGVVDTGRYVTALSLVAIVGALSDLGLTAVGVRELAAHSGPARWQLARDLLGLRITLTVAGGVVMTAIAWLAYSPELAAGVALACLGLLLQASQDNFAMPLLVGLRLGWVSALELGRQLLSTLLVVALVAAGAGLLPFLGISIPVGMATLAATLILVRGTRALSPSFDLRRWRSFVGRMLPYAFAIAASALYFRVAILLVSALSSAEQLGYFSASFRVIEVLTLVPGLLAGSAFPIFARAAQDDHRRLGYALGRVFEVSLAVGAWVAVSIAIAAPLAIRIIGGPSFKPAVPVLAIQGVGLGAMFVSLVWANGLLSLGLYRLILALNVGALMFSAALGAILIPIDGARGAAVATALAEIAAAILQALAVVAGRPALRPSLRVLPRVALASAAGLAPLALASAGVPTILCLAASTVLYAVVLLLVRALPRELLDLVPPLGPLARLGGRST
jgi:O-antigen/teichoic acid export membrane protein